MGAVKITRTLRLPEYSLEELQGIKTRITYWEAKSGVKMVSVYLHDNVSDLPDILACRSKLNDLVQENAIIKAREWQKDKGLLIIGTYNGITDKTREVSWVVLSHVRESREAQLLKDKEYKLKKAKEALELLEYSYIEAKQVIATYEEKSQKYKNIIASLEQTQ